MQHDVIIVGGSYAGISAALQLARARRRVLVIDAGVRRNRNAAHSHGFLGHDGMAPGEIANRAREQLLAYPTVTWRTASASSARATADGFEVVAGEVHAARRLVLALGVVDELPDIPGVAERWGRHIFHCPYCHGYELDRGDVGVIATSPASVHQAQLLTEWGTTTYFTRGMFEPDADTLADLTRRGLTIVRERVAEVIGDADVRLADGRVLSFAGLFVASRTRPATALATELGCELEESPIGWFIKTDAMKATSVPGIFACGDAALAMGSVAFAVGDGARAGMSAHRSLVFP